MGQVKVGITVVGCGGGFYHMLPAFTNTLNCMARMGYEPHILLVDPDTIEDRNKYRQWGGAAGQAKVDIAAATLADLWGRREIMVAADMVKEKHLCQEGMEEGVVLVLVDNHLARAQVHRSLWEMSLPYVVIEITGGNTKRDGWADGCVFEEGRTIRNDWGPRHITVFMDAREEMKPKPPEQAKPPTCAVQDEAFVGQTVESNMMTARLLMGVLGGMWFRLQYPQCFRWEHGEGGIITMKEKWLPEESRPSKTGVDREALVEEYLSGIPRLDQ